MKCNYCQNQAEWVENKAIYGKNYGKSYMMWLCKPCDAHVGCHLNTEKPLGTLANANLRALRKESKELFIKEKLNGKWSCKPTYKNRAYYWLARKLRISEEDCHFGMFDEEMCQRVIEILKKN